MSTTPINDPDYDPIGPLIRSIRLARKVKTSELARQTGIPRTGLDDLERGKRRLDIVELCKIARVLKVDPNELFRSLTAPYHANRLMEA